MAIRHLAASAVAAAATLIATPAHPQELTTPMTKFFVSIPLDATTHKDSVPNFGLQFQGSRPYQAVRIDYQTFKLLPGVFAAVEVKYVVAGAVAIGAAAALTHKDKSTSQSFQQQQQAQKESCTATC